MPPLNLITITNMTLLFGECRLMNFRRCFPQNSCPQMPSRSESYNSNGSNRSNRHSTFCGTSATAAFPHYVKEALSNRVDCLPRSPTLASASPSRLSFVEQKLRTSSFQRSTENSSAFKPPSQTSKHSPQHSADNTTNILHLRHNSNHSYQNSNHSHQNSNHSHQNSNHSHQNSNHSHQNSNHSHQNSNHSHQNSNHSHQNSNHSTHHNSTLARQLPSNCYQSPSHSALQSGYQKSMHSLPSNPNPMVMGHARQGSTGSNGVRSSAKVGYGSTTPHSHQISNPASATPHSHQISNPAPVSAAVTHPRQLHARQTSDHVSPGHRRSRKVEVYQRPPGPTQHQRQRVANGDAYAQRSVSHEYPPALQVQAPAGDVPFTRPAGDILRSSFRLDPVNSTVTVDTDSLQMLARRKITDSDAMPAGDMYAAVSSATATASSSSSSSSSPSSTDCEDDEVGGRNAMDRDDEDLLPPDLLPVDSLTRSTLRSEVHSRQNSTHSRQNSTHSRQNSAHHSQQSSDCTVKYLYLDNADQQTPAPPLPTSQPPLQVRH